MQENDISPYNVDWRSEDEKKLDLELENRSLELDLKLKGGIEFQDNDVDPKLHNAFLKNIENLP